MTESWKLLEWQWQILGTGIVILWVLTCWQQRLPLFSFPPQKPNAVPVPQASCWVPKIKSIYKTLLLSTFSTQILFLPKWKQTKSHTLVIVPLGFAAILHTQIPSQWWFLNKSGTTGAGRKDSPEWPCFCACKLDSCFGNSVCYVRINRITRADKPLLP